MDHFPAYIIPTKQICYRGCTPIGVPRFRIALFLAELFVPTNLSRRDIPLRLTVGRADASEEALDWEVPFPGGARLEPRSLQRYRGELRKSAYLVRAILNGNSMRVAIETSLLEWILPALRVNVIYLPEGHMDLRSEEAWRVELWFREDLINQWNGPGTYIVGRELFTRVRSSG